MVNGGLLFLLFLLCLLYCVLPLVPDPCSKHSVKSYQMYSLPLLLGSALWALCRLTFPSRASQDDSALASQPCQGAETVGDELAFASAISGLPLSITW